MRFCFNAINCRCFSIWPLLSTHCMSRELLLHLTTPNDTLSRPPLDEGSARRRDLYVTTQQKDTPARAIPAGERPQTHALRCAATVVGQCDRPQVTNSIRGVRTPHSRRPTWQQVNERDPRTRQSKLRRFNVVNQFLQFSTALSLLNCKDLISDEAEVGACLTCKTETKCYPGACLTKHHTIKT